MNIWRIPAELEHVVRERDKACVYCRVELIDKPVGSSRVAVGTWEHINSDVSAITLGNIARCCHGCNSSKGARTLAAWLQSQYCVARGINENTVAEVVRVAIKKAIQV